MVAVELTQRIFEGDIGAIASVSIPLALVIWWLIRTYILPARKWMPPSGPKEHTHFYRKKKVAMEKKPPGSVP